jgi:hypothetical protein
VAFERCQAAIERDYSLNRNEHLMERLSDNTPWALKLQEVTLPDAGEGWKAMAAVLDMELPVERKKRRRWLLLILLLPLASVSGYLVWRSHGVSLPVSPRAGYLPAKPGISSVPANGTVAANKRMAGNVGDPANGGTVLKRRTQMNGMMTPTEKTLTYGPGAHDELRRSESELRRSDPGSIISLGIAGPNLSGIRIAHPDDPLECPPVERQKRKGLVVGVGLNQSIPVDGQQFWFNSSGGLNTWWKDYIPVPFVRYYFQPKVFMQAEVRIHAPQYTTRNLSFAYLNDSMNFFHVFIKKLYYLQLPVTIHYAPSPAWSIGLGLQYSHYCSGITALADSLPNSYYSFRPLSDYPMVYARSSEFRGLVSLDYIYRHWIVGVSYDQAFTRAIGVRITSVTLPGPATFTELPPPVRNSSLQLYVRYILWDGRKQKPLLPSK